MKLLIILSTLFMLPVHLQSQSINARFSSSLYSFERFTSETESENHIRATQGLQLTVGQLASNKLSFRLNTLVADDFLAPADQTLFRISSGYLQWREKNGVIRTIKLGRQRLYTGVAFGAIDGIDMTARIGKHFKLGVFAGVLVTETNKFSVENWNNAKAFGFNLKFPELLGVKSMLSYIKRDRAREAYQSLLSTDSVPVNRAWSVEEQQLVGVDLLRNFCNKTYLHGRFDVDLYNRRVRKGLFGIRHILSDEVEMSFDFLHHSPFVARNSIFSVFATETSQSFAGRLSYRFGNGFSLNGNFGYVVYSGDESLRFGLNLAGKYGNIGYGFRDGYSGKKNGVHGAINYPFNRNIALFASTGFSRYQLFGDNAESYNSFTTSVGMKCRATKRLSFDVIAQSLNNRFYDSDLRFFIKGNYWLFHKF